MPSFTTPAGAMVRMKVRVDTRPYLAGFQSPPQNSKWENIASDSDGMGESRDFKMSSPAGAIVSFNGQFDEQLGADNPATQVTYKIQFSLMDSTSIGSDQVIVPKGMGPVARQYTFTGS